MAHAGGRPSEYSQVIVDKAQYYLDSCVDEEVQQVIGMSAKGTELYKPKLNVNLPTIEGLALFLGVHRDTLYEWAKIHPELSDTLQHIKTEQAKQLINKGLSGDYNSTIAKLILSVNHGMAEKTETDITSGGKALPTIIQIIKPEPLTPTTDENSIRETSEKA